jgi:two-component system, sensor histidine kinase
MDEETSEQLSGEGARRRRQANILLVDDNEANLMALEAILRPLGQRLIRARSAREALRWLLKEDFALILLDVRMPEMDGFETAQLIRMRARSEHTPIIFVTAFDKAEVDMAEGYQMGAVDFIFSPIVPEIVRAKVSVFVDLFELTEDQKRLFEEAQEASRAKSEFLNLAAHELRTPLSVVAGYASMLADGSLGDVPEMWRKPLDVLNGKCGELNRLVDELLLAARIETGRVPIRPSHVDLRDVLEAAADRNHPLAEMLGGEIVTELPRRPVEVQTDTDHLGRVLDNLIRNGLSYSVDPPFVRLALNNGSRPKITVEDRGIGIPSEYRDRIFERFFRVNDDSHTPEPGTGLGLYISRDLVHRLGGSLVLEKSEAGKGSVFTVELPPARGLNGTASTALPVESARLE